MDRGYVLGTGAAGAERLAMLERASAPGTEWTLRRAGIAAGMRVVDVGCGAGAVLAFVADQVGGQGTVVGVDADAAQLALARAAAGPGLRRHAELLIALGAARGQDWSIGLRLPALLRERGFAEPKVHVEQPATVSDSWRRIPGLNLVEARVPPSSRVDFPPPRSSTR